MLRRATTYVIPGPYPVVFESCLATLHGYNMLMPPYFTSGVQIAAANPQLGFITGYTRSFGRKAVRVDLAVQALPQGGCVVTFRSDYLRVAFIDYGRFHTAIEGFFAALMTRVLALNATPQPLAYLALPDGRPLSAQFFAPTPVPPDFAQTTFGQVAQWTYAIVALVVIFVGVVVITYNLSAH